VWEIQLGIVGRRGRLSFELKKLLNTSVLGVYREREMSGGSGWESLGKDAILWWEKKGR